MTLNQSNKLEVLIAELVPDLKPLVESIESQPATTQNHYGDYMAVLSMLAKGNLQMGRIIAAALVEAGANSVGVADAVKLSF